MTVRIHSNRPTIHANRGRALELTVIASQGTILTLEKIPSGVRYLRGGKTVPCKSLVDFTGTVNGSGRAIWFDAKTCDTPTRFDLGHRDHFTEMQRQLLIRHGQAGAMAGLLVEATALREYLWLDWRYFDNRASVPWNDLRWVSLGATTHTINFAVLLVWQSEALTIQRAKEAAGR